jgi:hypothetical protein
VVVATVSDQHARLAAWATDATADRWDRIQERDQLRDVVAVPPVRVTASGTPTASVRM